MGIERYLEKSFCQYNKKKKQPNKDWSFPMTAILDFLIYEKYGDFFRYKLSPKNNTLAHDY